MIRFDKYRPNPVKAVAAEGGAARTWLADYADLKPALDVADGLGRVMNNKKIYFRLLRNFAGSALVQDVAAALESGDHTKVQQAAHALKGVCANLGISELQGTALQIETRARAGEAAGDLWPYLEQAAAAAKAAIERLLLSEEGKSKI